MTKVKFYSWCTGKTTAAKQNSNLVDCESIMNQRTPKEIALKKVEEWRNNPDNEGKTLLISTKSLIGLDIYDNVPVAPSREAFIERMKTSKGMPRKVAESWYDYLLKNCPDLWITDDFVSDLES